MNMKYLTCLPLLVFLTCNKSVKTLSNEEFVSSINNYTYMYHETGNEKYLDSGYALLKLNKDFRANGLSNFNSNTVIALLLNLKKYNKLEMLLKKDTSMIPFNRSKVLNITMYLKLAKRDKAKADTYIKDNITMITDSLKKNPRDSIMYADYFSMRMYLVGKNKTLSEIDSMMSINNEFSTFFYEKILKESIINYPEKMLP